MLGARAWGNSKIIEQPENSPGDGQPCNELVSI